LRLCFGEGEIGFLTLPQGGSLRRNDEAGRGSPYSSFGAAWSAMDGAVRKMPSPLVPRDPPKERLRSVCDSALGKVKSDWVTAVIGD
jgi:hypothetical protein